MVRWRGILTLFTPPYNGYTPALPMKYRAHICEASQLMNEINPFHPSPAQLQRTRSKDLVRAVLLLNAQRGYVQTGFGTIDRFMRVDAERSITLTHRITDGKYLVRRVQVNKHNAEGWVTTRTEWVEDVNADWPHLIAKALQQPFTVPVTP